MKSKVGRRRCDFFRSYSRFTLQACLQKLFFLSRPKSFLWSLCVSKKKSAFAAQDFPLQSGLRDCAKKKLF
jgi:hypothetical protein